MHLEYRETTKVGGWGQGMRVVRIQKRSERWLIYCRRRVNILGGSEIVFEDCQLFSLFQGR